MRTILMNLTFILVIFPCYVWAQSDSTETEEKKTTLTLSSLVSSNASYYGQAAEKQLPFGYLDLKVRTPIGWYASAGGYQLLTEDAFPSEIHVGTGFEWELGKKVELGIGYTYSFYAKESPLLQASNPNSASASASFTHYFKTEVEADYNFGQTKDIFISFNNSKDIKLAEWGSNLLHVNPALNIVGGTQRFYTTYVEERKTQSGGLGGLLPVPGKGQSEFVETTEESTSFNILSYNMQVPFIWYRGQGAVLLSYQLSFLTEKTEQEKRQNSFFSLGYFYQF
ncbi:hypothetical protein [Pseudopedobacter sp.]|uniref:hypothetical protein n=1 Tax=Pseudopedobacter sp. TaxID=1936787 RepID=UPI00334226E5